MTALDKLKATQSRTRFLLKIVGFDIFDNFRMNIISYLTIVDCISYMIINTYDIKLFWGDLIRVCFCLVTWSFGYQGSARIIVFLTKRHKIQELYEQVYDFIRKMERQIQMEKFVNKYSRYIYFQTKGMIFLYYSTGALTLIYPVFVYIFTKKIILPFGFVIPGLNDTTQPGYALNYAHHILQVHLTVGGLTASSCMNVMYLIGACLMIEVCIAQLKVLGKQIIEQHRISNSYKDINFKEIIEFHQNILQFVITLESLFSMMFLIDVIFIPFQIIITLMVCTKQIWIPGIMIMVCVSTLLLLDCGYGLFIEMKFESLSAAVYDLPWHLMSAKDRKMIQFILARTQKPPLLTFGKMAYMNMATFVQIYKSIYSYFMVLKSFEG